MSIHLSKENLDDIRTVGVIKPGSDIFSLPEKVLQFGTGVLLRGLPDYFIDKANRMARFNGRIVVVKSTDSGDTRAFDRQDGLYTLCVRGIEEGHRIEENIICSAISRVLSARDQWKEVLQLAHRPEMQIVISNTTEVGIQLVADDDIHRDPPVSFPGKLLAFLYERFKAFGASADSGIIIVPTELLVDNGKKLAAIVRELATINRLETAFLDWLDKHCRFCSSLVDRIVPGRPDSAALQQLQHDLGYTDDLLAISEVYRLWAIEGDEKVKDVLSFAAADDGVIINPDIQRYRELKLRLLNGTHTLSCGLAFLSGFSTVKQAMDDTGFSTFVSNLMLKEIATAVPYKLSLQEARDFGLSVLDRFRNPHLQHQWLSITMQYSSKVRSRDIPVLLRHYDLHQEPPPYFTLGFAAYLLFMRAVWNRQDTYYGEFRGQPYTINDDKAAYYYDLWRQYSPAEVANLSLKNKDLWGTDLSLLPGFEGAVRLNLEDLINKGPVATLARLTTKMTAL